MPVLIPWLVVNKYLEKAMYFSEWIKILKEKLEKSNNIRSKIKKPIDKDSEHYPIELV